MAAICLSLNVLISGRDYPIPTTLYFAFSYWANHYSLNLSRSAKYLQKDSERVLWHSYAYQMPSVDL